MFLLLNTTQRRINDFRNVSEMLGSAKRATVGAGVANRG
jgi:hypothetical protein